VREHETGGGTRQLDHPRLAERRPRVGEPVHGQSVPAGHDLVVPGRVHPLLAGPCQPSHQFGDTSGHVLRRGCPRGGEVGHGAGDPWHRTGSRDAEMGEEELDVVVRLARQRVADLRGCPQGEAALLALGIGVEGRRERVAVAHLPLHPAADPQGDGAVAGRAGGEGEVGVQLEELPVVIEHLLEVREAPSRVGGVAGEAAAELVVDPPVRHGRQGDLHHRERVGVAGAGVVPQQEHEYGRHGELRRAPEAAPAAVGAAGEAGDGVVEGARRHPHRGGDRGRGPQGSDEVAGIACDRVPLGEPGVGDGGEHVRERGQPGMGGRGPVGAGEEGQAVRGEEDAEGPPAAHAHRLGGGHVDGVDVGPLLAVHLDRHVGRVQQGGDAGVLERLAGHDVAPVARRVADAEEHRHVPSPGGREGLLAPRVPVHRVVGVLLEVRAGRAREPVRHPTTVTPAELCG